MAVVWIDHDGLLGPRALLAHRPYNYLWTWCSTSHVLVTDIFTVYKHLLGRHLVDKGQCCTSCIKFYEIAMLVSPNWALRSLTVGLSPKIIQYSSSWNWNNQMTHLYCNALSYRIRSKEGVNGWWLIVTSCSFLLQQAWRGLSETMPKIV